MFYCTMWAGVKHLLWKQVTQLTHWSRELNTIGRCPHWFKKWLVATLNQFQWLFCQIYTQQCAMFVRTGIVENYIYRTWINRAWERTWFSESAKFNLDLHKKILLPGPVFYVPSQDPIKALFLNTTYSQPRISQIFWVAEKNLTYPKIWLIRGNCKGNSRIGP